MQLEGLASTRPVSVGVVSQYSGGTPADEGSLDDATSAGALRQVAGVCWSVGAGWVVSGWVAEPSAPSVAFLAQTGPWPRSTPQRHMIVVEPEPGDAKKAVCQ